MNRIDPRLLHLRAHPNLSRLCEILPFYIKRIVKDLMETGSDISPDGKSQSVHGR
jgi:hypothetical protein